MVRRHSILVILHGVGNFYKQQCIVLSKQGNAVSIVNFSRIEKLGTNEDRILRSHDEKPNDRTTQMGRVPKNKYSSSKPLISTIYYNFEEDFLSSVWSRR